jgi:hypothetical protein
MALERPIATSFNGGELSPRMGGRVDTSIYSVGLAVCENFVPTVEGALVKRPGFEYIEPAAVTATWLTSFRFNLTQDYVIEWSDGKLRFYTNGARIETSPGVPFEVVVPYTAAEAPLVSAQQSFDRLYLDHPNHPPARLTRTSATTFAYDVAELVNGPFADANIDDTISVSASATTGSGVALSATASIFTSDDVGTLFRLEAQDFSAIPAWMPGINGIVVGTSKVRNDGKVYLAVGTSSDHRTGQQAPIHTSGTEWDGIASGQDINAKGPYGVQWEYLYDRFGIALITAVGSGTAATADIVRRLPDAIVTGTWRWAHASLSAGRGWPSVVKAWNGRLIHFRGFDMLASVAGDFLNHATFDPTGLLEVDLAFRRTLTADDPVLWALGDRRLIVGTASAEIAIGSINEAVALSGDNVQAVPQSNYGSEAVFPLQIGSTAAVFVQRGGRKLRQAEYDFARDRYIAENITIWARHITGGGIVQLAYQQEPEQLLVALRSDGQLVTHPQAPEQDIKGMARIRVGGDGVVKSVTTIAAADGKTDELWALVDRDGALSVERMAPWRDDGDPIETSFFVDGGVTAIAGIGQVHFSNLMHLAGREVWVLADGGVITGITIANDGTFSISPDAIPSDRPYIITVGLPYTATATTLRPELRGNGQTSQGIRQRVVQLILRLIETTGLRVGVQGGKLDELINRAGNDTMDAPIPLFTGDTGQKLSGNWDRTGQSTVVSDAPLPAVIVAAMPTVNATT